MPYAAYLRPSRELLEYYRKKIAEFDDEHESMLRKLDQYKMTYEEQVWRHTTVCIIFNNEFTWDSNCDSRYMDPLRAA